MRLLDGVVQLSVLSRAHPPTSPVAGDRYILPSICSRRCLSRTS
ncbi:DUF2793 domain-containing protein [uncultured Planktomarina sp.]